MSAPPPITEIDAAVEWILRLESPQASEVDWLAFDAWLSADPQRAEAYDRALRVAEDVRLAGGLRPAANVIPFPRRAAAPAAQPRRRVVLGGMAAAAVAALVGAPLWMASQPTIYATAPGEHRTVSLKDGSRVDLNGASRLSVEFSRGQRTVSLDGEAVFDVARDASRPFVIAAGDRQVRVIGTQFDVRRREGRLSVIVARGVVEVAPTRTATGATLRLTAGHRLDHTEGAADGHVSTVVAEEVLGWRGRRLIYRDAPLSDVVADLNAQFQRPMTLSDGAGALRFSGVLVVDDQEEVVKRLAALAPISSTVAKNEIVLRADASAR